MKIAEIKQRVSQETGVSIEAMEQTGKTGGLRTQRVALARAMVVWVARNLGEKHSYGHIAMHGKLGTVAHAQSAYKKCTKARALDWDYRDHTDRMLEWAELGLCDG